MDLKNTTIHGLSASLSKREISSMEATRFFLKRIEELDGRIRAFITVTPEEAMKDAAEADKKLAGKTGLTPLTGVPSP